MSLVPTFLSNILPDDPVGEIKVDWSHSIGFTTLNSLYIVLFKFRLVDPPGVFSIVSASQRYLVIFK